MRKILFLLMIVFCISSQCQTKSNMDGGIPVVFVKYSPLADIIGDMIHEEESKSYFSNSLNYILYYYETVYSHNIYMDTSQSHPKEPHMITSGTPVYTFIFTPCPEGIPTIEYVLLHLLKYGNHYFYLMNYNDCNRCDSVLFTPPRYHVPRDEVKMTLSAEDDRWPHYYYRSSLDTNGFYIIQKSKSAR